MYVPATEEVQERVDEPELVRLVGVSVQVRPVAGNTEAVRLTTPVKPLRAATVIPVVFVPGFVAMMTLVTLVGRTVKSLRVYITMAWWDSEPLVPTTVTA